MSETITLSHSLFCKRPTAASSGCRDAKGRAISGWRYRGSFDNPRTCDHHRCSIACNFDGDPAASHPEVVWTLVQLRARTCSPFSFTSSWKRGQGTRKPSDIPARVSSHMADYPYILS